MTFDLFEGPAGTGKTYNLVGLAAQLIRDGVLGEERKLLALTFMNGARRRLEAKLSCDALFRRRFECQTFDVFARTLSTRRRSLLCGNVAMTERAASLNEFDGPCFLSASLLEYPSVRQWVALTFPLVLVDEAQDLDEHRLRILQRLSQSSRVAVAADAFQCLLDGRDTAPLIHWLENAGQTHRLTEPQRTRQRGLLAAAVAVRKGGDIKAVLTAKTFKNGTSFHGEGFRLLEVSATAKNPALLSWSISNEIAQHRDRGRFAILTPDAGNSIIRAALGQVQTKQWTRRNGATFGPFPHVWDSQDNEEADALLNEVSLPQNASYTDLKAVLASLTSHAAIAQVMSRIDRLRRVKGQNEFSDAQITEFVRDAVRNQSRLGFRQQRGHLAMTIQRAKNREFPNVIVLWPHTVTGSSDHLRRLLYNAITRAQSHCSVIVLGQGRLNNPPFSPRVTGVSS